MPNSLRPLACVIAALCLVNCADLMREAGPIGARPASLAIAPRFASGASRTAALLSQAGLSFDRVRVLVIRPASDTLADSTMSFHASDTTQTLVLNVLAVPNDSLIVTIQYAAGTTVLFEGSVRTTATPLSAPTNATNAISINVTYTGPGAAAKSISISPATGAIASGTTTQFSATALDANGGAIANAPIVWSVSDTSIATIDATGLLTPRVTRGTVVVNAELPSVKASREVKLAPLGTAIRVVQGAAQTGPPGTQLPLPVIVELVASDGLPGLGGGTVTFVPNGGGSASPSTATLDTNGRAGTLLTLGSNAGGIYLYTITVASLPALIIPEIAVVGPPTQLIPSGSTSITMTAGIAPSPIPTFRVADALGNSVPNVPLKATIRLGSDSTVTPTFLADTIGLGDVSKIAAGLTLAGTYTVTFASANSNVTFPSLTYTVTVLPAEAVKLAFDVQPSNVTANTAMSPAVTVRIQDKYGNTVTSSTALVTIGLDPTTGSGATITGASVNAIGGVATFSTLKFTPSGITGVRLSASSGILAAALSAAFNIL